MFLDFTKSEKRGILLISVLILITIILKAFIVPALFTTNNQNFKIFEKTIDDFIAKQNEIKKNEKNEKKFTVFFDSRNIKENKINYKKINPNTANISDWQNLGFSYNQAKSITKYIKKSGGITQKSQLKKIYVISNKKYNKIKDFIIIPKQKEFTKQSYKEKPKQHKNTKQEFLVELNSANASELIKLNGIGEILSERIIKYRDKLGGFIDINQLTEVYGLKPETLQKITNNIQVNTTNIKKININFSDAKELSKHPYITYAEARKLVSFRAKNGFIKSIEIIKKQNIFSNKNIYNYLVIYN